MRHLAAFFFGGIRSEAEAHFLHSHICLQLSKKETTHHYIYCTASGHHRACKDIMRFQSWTPSRTCCSASSHKSRLGGGGGGGGLILGILEASEKGERERSRALTFKVWSRYFVELCHAAVSCNTLANVPAAKHLKANESRTLLVVAGLLVPLCMYRATAAPGYSPPFHCLSSLYPFLDRLSIRESHLYSHSLRNSDTKLLVHVLPLASW